MEGLCKVLIVDDEILVRDGIKHHLNWEQTGFRIVGEASNGREALEQIETLRPHIVITDIVMPIMDGEAFTRVVKEQYPEIEIIVLSSFSEYDYVRSTFQSGVADYILKPKLETQDLLKVLKQTAIKIPSLHLREELCDCSPSIDLVIDKLISGYHSEYEIDQVHDTFPYNRFCLFGIVLKGSSCTNTQDRKQLFKNITTELQRDRSDIVIYPIKDESDKFVLLLNMDQSEIARVVHTVKLLSGTLDKTDNEIKCVLSKTFDSFQHLGTMYKESLVKLIEFQFYFPAHRLLIQSELPELQDKISQFNLNQFTDDFKRGQFDTALQRLREHLKSSSQNYRMEVFEFKSFLGNIIFNITILLGNMDYEIKELEETKYACFKSIDESKDVSAAIHTLEAFIEKVNQCIASKQNQVSHTNMKRLLEYIDEHYAEPLNLTEVASHFHFNPSYLSSYFSAHNNEGFSEYVNKVRIEKAEVMLRSDEAPISEISNLVGYSDHSYFCKVFKRFTGRSPSQYRKQYHK
jgi:two-component system response regulator YesN